MSKAHCSSDVGRGIFLWGSSLGFRRFAIVDEVKKLKQMSSKVDLLKKLKIGPCAISLRSKLCKNGLSSILDSPSPPKNNFKKHFFRFSKNNVTVSMTHCDDRLK